MKRRLPLALALLGLLAVSLTGCGSDSTAGQLTGTWYLAGSATPAFTLDGAPSDCPQATQTGRQLAIPTPTGQPQTAVILSQENGQLTLGFPSAGVLTFRDAPEPATSSVLEGGGSER